MAISPQFEVVISATPEELTTGTIWFGSARVTGLVNGERFSASFDFSHDGFATKEEAETYARQRAQERIERLLVTPFARGADPKGESRALPDAERRRS